MKRRLVALCSLALVMSMAVPATGQITPEARPAPTAVAIDGRLTGGPSLDEVVSAFIRLSEPAVAEIVATGGASTAAQKAQAARIERQQADVLAAFDFESQIYSLRVGANGVAVKATVRNLIEVSGHAEVVSVSKLPVHRFDNATSVPWIEAASAWQDLGYTGAGLSIGIIDTGIDYLHADFGGIGSAEAFDTNDPTTLDDGGFTAKVAGGYDFVGDDYDASTPGLDTPNPDPDPLDCNGHGTHVAGSAAGQGVLSDGSTFTGPYDSTTFELYDWEVGPGVAPEATLYALKVFGCDGSTNVTVEAIEWALDPNGDGSMDDMLDVINMSLGSDFGQPDDPTAIAANNAMEAGMLVVSAAGNDGPVPYVHGSPGSAALGIAVAASVDDGIIAGAIVVNSPDAIAGQYESAEGAFTAPLDEVGPVIGDLVVADPLRACGDGAGLANAAEVAGNIALIQRGDCAFVEKIANAQSAGAIGVVVFNNVSGPPIVMGGNTDEITIPGVMISDEDGALIIDSIASDETVNVTLSADFQFPKPELADTLASFTSQGPRGGDLFGPDLAAPGFSIDSAANGTGFKGRLSSGTSMATPHVAGLAALMRQAHPTADTADIKAMLMNSTVDTNGFYETTRMGTGVVRADRALSQDAVAFPAGVSFGRLNPTGPSSATQSVTVTDMSGEARTYAVAHTPLQEMAGVTVDVPSSVEVPANGTKTFDITLDLDPAAMPVDDGFFSQTEVDGLLDLTSGDASMRVGYLAVVDPASLIETEGVKNGQQNSLLFANSGQGGGWLDTFTHIADGAGTLAAIGIRDAGGGVVEFGVASSAPWDSLSRRELDVYIDADKDGAFEWAVVAADLGYLTGAGADGRVVTAVFDLVNGGGFLRFFAVADVNDHSQILPVDLSTFIGEAGSFDFLAIDFDFATPTGIAEGSVNIKQDVERGENISYALLPGETAGIAGFQRQNREALLALYQNNPVPAQFEVVQLKPGNRVGR